MVKHENVVGYIPLFHRLDVVFAKGDGKSTFYRRPAVALAIAKDDSNPSITFLVPMVVMGEDRDIDLAHEENIIGYDDGSREVDWKRVAERYEASMKKS